MEYAGIFDLAGDNYMLTNVKVEIEQEPSTVAEATTAGGDESKRPGMKQGKIASITADLVVAPEIGGGKLAQKVREAVKNGQKPDFGPVVGNLSGKVSPKKAARIAKKDVMIPFFQGQAKLEGKGEYKLYGRLASGGPKHGQGPRGGGQQGPGGFQGGPSGDQQGNAGGDEQPPAGEMEPPMGPPPADDAGNDAPDGATTGSVIESF